DDILDDVMPAFAQRASLRINGQTGSRDEGERIVHAGVFAALMDFMGYMETEGGGGGGGGGGFQRAAFGGGGGVGGGGGGGNLGGMGGGGLGGAGASETAAGGPSQGGPGGGGGGSQALPSEVADRARQLIASGGNSQQLSDFMRSQGYPRNGAWCGQFAASVVRSVGGTPPAGAETASHRRKWGEPVS